MTKRSFLIVPALLLAACTATVDKQSVRATQTAPESTQATSFWICSAESGLFLSPGGGIRSSSAAVTRRTNSLSPLLPATNSGPESPPPSARSRWSNRRPDSCLSGPWQA